MSNLTAAQQSATFYARRRSKSRRLVAGCTPWSVGLVIAAGDIVQSFSMAFEAQNDGTTTAGNAPNNSGGAAFTGSDGIMWVHEPLLLVAPPLIA